MTVKELQEKTKCRLFILYEDADGTGRRVLYTGGAPGRLVKNFRIIHEPLYGHAIGVELEEEE